MELQVPFTNEAKSRDKIFRQLFEIQMILEQFNESQSQHSDEIRRVVESIDHLFESVIKNESWVDP